MAWFSRKVVVTFIDDATGASFGTTRLPPTDLPESFEIQTTLHLGNVDWSVVHAEPRTRPEYAKSRSLTLRLRRIEKIDPAKILFSLPSICDRLPLIGAGNVAVDDCVLAEDDWRQLELVSQQFASETESEIQAIRVIHEEECASVGWRNIHVRRRPDPPIAAFLTRQDLAHAFGEEITFRGVTYRGASSPIVSGYSFMAADAFQCYGTEEDGCVTVMGFVQDFKKPPSAEAIYALGEIARDFDLELVNWCRCERASWDSPLFRRLLGADADVG